MFGRRRHAAQAVAPTVEVAEASTPLPRLAEEQIFELVHTRIAAAIGEGGEWVVRRRTPEDTDDLFRTVLAHQVALDVTGALQSAQLQLEAGEQLTVATRDGAVALRSGVHVDEGAVLGHYAEHADKPFFGELVSFLTRSPVFAMVVEGRGDNAFSLVRQMVGATKVDDALPGTIRGDFAAITTENLVHASDSHDSAGREIALWFPSLG